ncbi:unnamed protein product [Dibothriocephalus latus]|uniref:Uncharacterized protein n=1 Tax=Dibothriocephalus latus TaxID=60516 RepID=A0A3P6UBU7_DIBLA|nr:unnamed protein product [Dibothriocephalus latus]
MGAGPPKLPDPAMSSKVCSNCGFIAYAVIMILLLCLLGALLLILPLTMLLASEGCTYLESASGAAKTDYLLNRYIQQAWPLLLNRTLNSSSADDNITLYLLLEPPRDLIKAATRTCRNSTNGTLEAGHVGLLNLTGWHTIINVSKLIESDTVNGTIQRGQQ